MSNASSRLAVLVLAAVLASAPGILRAQSGDTGEPPLRFNGDPFADLAIGAPYAWVGAVQAGAVNVLHGSSPDGLTALQSQLWDQSVLGSDPHGAEAGDEFGYSLEAADFNGDRHLDLAIGVPSESWGNPNAGAVNVVYGSPTGLSVTGNQFWHMDIGGPGDRWGFSLAGGDFNGDGFADLAIGIPFSDAAGGIDDAGSVWIIYGSSDGLTPWGYQSWYQDSPGVAGYAEPDDGFGYALAAGDFNRDGRADLAIGVVAEDYAVEDDGVVHVLYGSAAGLTADDDDLWYEGALGATAAVDDFFGTALASGDFNGDGADDLAVSAGGRQVGGSLSAGVVYVIFGSDAGLVATGSQAWSQDSPGVGGVSEPNDHFGSKLAAGDLDGNGCADLAVGVPDESLAANYEGCVNVLYGSASGLVASPTVWAQDSPGIADSPETDDLFGSALAIGDFDGDAYGDLAVGAPGEILESLNNSSGAVHVLYGSQDGLSAAGSQFWHQEVPGVPGEGGGYFGAALASVPISRILFIDGFESGDTSAWSATVP